MRASVGTEQSVLPPFWQATVRCIGLFLSFGTLAKYNVPPCVLALIVAVTELCGHVARDGAKASARISQGAKISRRLVLLCAIEGVWNCLNTVILFSIVEKLHPLRVVIGEQLINVFKLPRWPKWSIVLFVNGVVVLAWANNLSTTHDVASNSDEDRIVGSDSFAGVLLLLIYCASEEWRCRFVKWLQLAECSDEDRIFVAPVASAVSGLVALCLSVLLASAKGSALNLSAVGLQSGFVDSIFLVLPFFLFQSPSSRTRRLRDWVTGQLLGSTFVGFLLHTLYHHHYVSGRKDTSEFHPLFHIDNVMVLVSSALFASGFLVSIAAPSHNMDDAIDSGPAHLFFTTGSGDLLHRDASHIFEMISHNAKQRKLFFFFLLTLSFMLVELLYGLHANSLSLVSDSFHMLLDSASIALGLVTAFMATWRRTTRHPFGFGGYEVLSGFANGVVLMVIAVFILGESIARLFEPPDVESGYLLFVATTGLVVNVIGVVFFHEAHSHGHSHDGSCCHDDDHNMRGVYLHILADLLGSVGVIVSSIVVKFTGWMVADPVCSAAISTLILFSAAPLLRETGGILAFSLTGSRRQRADSFLEHVLQIDGVVKISASEIWMHSGNAMACCLSVAAAAHVERDAVRQRIRELASISGFCSDEDLTVEVL